MKVYSFLTLSNPHIFPLSVYEALLSFLTQSRRQPHPKSLALPAKIVVISVHFAAHFDEGGLRGCRSGSFPVMRNRAFPSTV